MFGLQVESIRVARGLIRCLPPSSTWSLTVTDDVLADYTCGVFNIFVPTEEQRVRVRKLLKFTGPVDEGDDFETYKIDGLMVSIIEATKPEGKDDGSA